MWYFRENGNKESYLPRKLSVPTDHYTVHDTTNDDSEVKKDSICIQKPPRKTQLHVIQG